MASVNGPQQVIINHEGRKKKPRIEAQVDTVMVETEETISGVPTTSVTWIPVMEQVLEFEVVESAGNKAGKMKARARAKEKPTTKAGLESGTLTSPPARKSQRARQPPAKFRYLIPRPLGQQTIPPMAPGFVRPPGSSGIQPLPLPQNLVMPFPPIPVSSPPGSSTLPAPANAVGAVHLSTFRSINDQALQPTSTSALTPTLLVPRAQPAFAERRRLPVANKRIIVRKKLPPSPSQEHAGLSQSSLSHSQSATLAGTASPSSAGAIVSETALRRGGTPTCTGSCSMCATQVASGSSWPNAIQDPRSSLRPYVGSDIDRTLSPRVENGAVTAVRCRCSAGKPPLPPNSWFLRYVRRNPPHPPPPILKRSFAHVPPPPTHDSRPMVPPRASLNNRDLRFPRATVSPHYPPFAKSQVAHASSSSQSVPWLVPQGDGNQRRVLGSEFSGQSNGINIPGPTRSQQKRRMRQLKNGIGKKFQDLMQGATLIQEPDSHHKGVTTVKQIVLTDEQRTKLVNEMIEACRSDPKFRAKYLDAVKQLSYFGVLQTASYQLVAQGPSKAAQEVVDAWKSQPPPNQEGSTSASLKFYRAVNKVHEEAVETMQKLPNLREAGSCSVTKRNDGAWVVTLPDEKKRKLNGETRPTSGS